MMTILFCWRHAPDILLLCALTVAIAAPVFIITLNTENT